MEAAHPVASDVPLWAVSRAVQVFNTAALTVTRAKVWSCVSFIIARSIRAFSLPDEEFFPVISRFPSAARTYKGIVW